MTTLAPHPDGKALSIPAAESPAPRLTPHPRVKVPFQQAVYGSFAFRPGGYALLGASSTLAPRELDAFLARCRGWGEPPPGFAFLTQPVLLIEYLKPRGPWLIIGIWCTGPDDLGRPSALGFHGLFVRDRDLARINHDPFRMAEALRTDWAIISSFEPARAQLAAVPAVPHSTPCSANHFTAQIRNLRRGRCVVLEAEAPDLEPIKSLFLALRPRQRRRTPMATWIPRADARYRLMAVPRVEPAALPSDPQIVHPAPSLGVLLRSRRGRRWTPRIVACLILASAVGGMSLLRGRHTPQPGSNPPRAFPTPPQSDLESIPPPDATHPWPDTPALAHQLLAILEPLENAQKPAQAHDELARLKRLLRQIGERTRYSGPTLSTADRARLARDAMPGSTRALAWDDHIQHLRAGRPLPRTFDHDSLARQLHILLWAYRVPTPERIEPTEAAALLVETLTLDESLTPNPLEPVYPQLTSYRTFLADWPRR